jgi:hypothetical protein
MPMDRKVTIRPTGYRINESHATGLMYPSKYAIFGEIFQNNLFKANLCISLAHLTTNLATSAALWTATLLGVISVRSKIATWK